MFSSLPSASKIYVNSSNAKPRQKSAASSSASRRKKKKSLTSSGSDGGPTLVSLVDPAKNSLENRFESPPTDSIDRTFKVSRNILSEDSEFFDETDNIRTERKCSKESNLSDTFDLVKSDGVSSEDDDCRVDSDPRPRSPSPQLNEDPHALEGCCSPSDRPVVEQMDTRCMSESLHVQDVISNCVQDDCAETDGLQELSNITSTLRDPEVITEHNAQTIEEEGLALVCNAPEKYEDHSIGEQEKLSLKDKDSLDSTQEEESLYAEQERARSPEHGELSCTESCASKTPDSEQLEEAPTSCLPDVSRSCSDLGNARGNRILRRSSSFPKTRNTSTLEDILGSLAPIKRVTCVDKETATVEFPCEGCRGKEEQRAVDRLTTNKAVSAEMDLNKPLTTAQARSRSYVYGSTGHSGSLLGNEELNRLFPDNEVTIFVGTWNMNSHVCKRSLY